VQLILYVANAGYVLSDIFRHAFRVPIIHRTCQRDQAVGDAHVNVRGINIMTASQSFRNVFTDALVRALIALRPAARITDPLRIPAILLPDDMLGAFCRRIRQASEPVPAHIGGPPSSSRACCTVSAAPFLIWLVLVVALGAGTAACRVRA